MAGQGNLVAIGQSPQVAFEPPDCGAHLRTTDVGDSLATLLDQVRSGNPPYFPIVNSDEIGRKAQELPIQQNVRHLPFFRGTKALDCALSRGHQQNIHSSGEKLLDFLLFQLRVFIREGNQDTIPPLVNRDSD
jgi:hypothetical protein